MESRGFGRVRAPARGRVLAAGGDLVLKGLTLVGLAGVLCGLFMRTYFQSMRLWGGALAAASAVLLLIVFWLLGRRVLRVYYRRYRWTWRDAVVWVPSLAVTALLVLTRLRAPGVLEYSSYDSLVPPFDPLFGLALMFLLAPLLVTRADDGRLTSVRETTDGQTAHL
jgi:hypothetical protein